MNRRAGITTIGSYLPDKKITNADLEKRVDTSDLWIRSRTGIRERRKVSENENCSDIAALACKKAVEGSNVKLDEIDLIIATSLSYDKLCPSTASIIQGKLGMINAAAFDISAACAGFTYSLNVASSLINAGNYKNVLVVGAEAISRLIDYEDRNTCILFGDGAGATLLQPVDEQYGIIASCLENDGSKAHYIEIPAGGSAKPATTQTVKEKEHFLKMKGQEVYKFAVRVIPHAINKILTESNLNLNDVDLIIPHQANLRIIEAAAKKLGIGMDKFYANLEYLGNTSTASVPLALEQAVNEGRIKKGSVIITVGFGAGLSLGVNLIKWAY